MQRVIHKGVSTEKQNDLLKLFWVFALLFFLAIGFAAHAALPKAEPILLGAPNLYGKNFFSVLINSPDPKEAPKNFRLLVASGIDNLHASASAVLSKGQIDFLISKLNSDATPGTLGQAKQIHIIDTSSHAHGFVNNMQVIWLDQNIKFGTADHAFYDQEKSLLEALKKSKKVTLYALPVSVDDININVLEVEKLGGQKIQVQADAVETEQQFAKSKKLLYTRIPMLTNEMAKVEDRQIEQLAQVIKKSKKDEWFHFHNEAGDVRLSLAILIADVLKNASSGTTLDEILNRQNQLSAQVKLSAIPMDEKLQNLYSYAKEQGPDFKIPFSKWNQKH